MAATATLWARASPSSTLLCNGYRHFRPKPSPIRPLPSSHRRHLLLLQNSPDFRVIQRERTIPRSSRSPSNRSPQRVEEGNDDVRRRLTQIGLWVMEGIYVLWLFLLPYAPGDPVWAVSSETINSLVGLSLNFFFILPFANAVVGRFPIVGRIGARQIAYALSPALMCFLYFCQSSWHTCHGGPQFLHPMSEGLFNFVLSWTLMFAPLLYTDSKRDRYKGSLDVLWGLQMFLTNTFLIPYMAIRQNQVDEGNNPKKPSQLGVVMIKGARIVGLIGGAVCLISILWALFGRMDGGFGSLSDRWNYLLSYAGSERLAYAFIWDIVLYSIFQPWLIGDNLENVEEDTVGIVNSLRYIPVVGLVAYLLFLKIEEELYTVE